MTKLRRDRWTSTRPGTALYLSGHDHGHGARTWSGTLREIGVDLDGKQCFVLHDGPVTVMVPFEAVAWGLRRSAASAST